MALATKISSKDCRDKFEKDILGPLKERNIIGYCDIRSRYEDILALIELFAEIESSVKFTTPESLSSPENFKLRRQLSVLLQALYMFADIYIQVLLKETVDRGTLIKFLKSPPISLPNDCIREAYCIVVYRNKLIVHHDFSRMHSFSYSHNDRTLRLIPVIYGLTLPEAHVEHLNKLFEKYAPTSTEVNGFQRLRDLFYSIPPTPIHNGNLNPDRKEIDKIAEQCGGVESMTCSELIKTIDSFSLAVIDQI